ncbi:hypothetical protein D6855_03955 [Butyrivibrio sp. CB08]|uniref:YfhO family protein n=1 Tax=Butyrivibrio sp. CB08 TaxID=2364879 RepID=UPI000EAA7294|nr:YfhO family protein [Butyrivibrio sp. CB08]RKM61061.1 hypothetical protein D6855_03955 [Butyrivibrio sp. CB08]
MFNEESLNGKVNIKHGLIASLFILVMFLIVLVAGHIAPFGDETFLMYDLKRQYADYYAYYRTVLSGQNNIFYSFSTTLGSGTMGFFAYYMSSPFIMLLSLFSQDKIYLGIVLVIGLKLMIAAFIMDFVLQKAFGVAKEISLFETESAALYIGAVSWAFSGFLFAHSMNLMWIDVVMLLPLFIYFLEKLLVQNRKAPYIIILAIMVMLNYYITYQVVLFAALWTIMRLVVLRLNNPFPLIGRVIYSSAISGAISAALMIPTFLGLMDSPKDVALLGMNLKNSNLSPVDFISKLPTMAYDVIEARFGYPQLFCGILLTFLALMFFVCRQITLRERLGMAALVLFMALSMCIDLLNIIWHAGMEPSGHPYRQAFFYVFLVILCAERFLLAGGKEILTVKALILVAIMYTGLFLIARGGYDHITTKGIIINAALIACYVICGAVMLLIHRDKEKAFAVAIVLFLLANMVDLTGNALYTYRFQAFKCDKGSEYSDMVSKTLEAVTYVKGEDSSFYRMETLNPRQQNDALQYNFNGVTHYSSAGLIYMRYFLQRLGYNDDGLYLGYGHDNTETADSILGVKYLVGDETHLTHDNYRMIFEGNRDVYVNPYALSVAVGTDGYDYSAVSDPDHGDADSALTHVPSIDPFALQEDIYSRLTGREEKFFVPALVSDSGISEVEDKYRQDFEVTAAMDGEMYFYLNGLIGADEGLAIFINDELLTTYGNSFCTKVLNLGTFNSGDSFTLTVQAENAESSYGSAVFVTEDIKALERAYSDASKRNCEVIKKSSSHLVINCGDHEGVFITVPYEKGWNIKVDGRMATPVAVYDALTYIPIAESASFHTIDMVYVPKGLSLGCVISLIGIVSFFVVVALEKKRASL